MDISLFERRFAENLHAAGAGRDPARLLVACSGGIDSIVLLYLLRFGHPEPPHSIVAAHFDHAMRPSSGEDAAWVRGICHAWRIPLHSERTTLELRNETAAREERYRFLRTLAAEIGVAWILTAHHADDQAETILFRVLRGTGLAGLRGIPPRSRGLLRPLLPFWRAELEEYAGSRGLRWREDPSNETLIPARNRIRNEILPVVEREIAPGARRSLVSLAILARENEEGWREIVDGLIERTVTEEEGGFAVDRTALREASPAAGVRLIRELLRRLGVVPDRVGTRSALQFITDASSGREISLPAGVRISTEFGRAILRKTAISLEDVEAAIERPAPGTSASVEATLGGRRYRGRLSAFADGLRRQTTGAWIFRIPSTAVFPVRLRARRPGDRIRTAGGTKSLKRLMIERKIPRSERAKYPVLVDDSGAVLWVAGLAGSVGDGPTDEDLWLEVWIDG